MGGNRRIITPATPDYIMTILRKHIEMYPDMKTDILKGLRAIIKEHESTDGDKS